MFKKREYELIDKDGKVYSVRFETSKAAAVKAEELWPDQPHDPDRSGLGWDVAEVEMGR